MITKRDGRVVPACFSGALIAMMSIAVCLGATVNGVRAQAPTILPAGTLPDDVRLHALKDLDGYFPFQPAESPAQWAVRAERVRQQLRVALGLWPMPEKTPLNAVVHGKVDREEYTVEKVCFESHPGFFVTGSLYRPKGRSGKLPAVLCPHGHWQDGRFYDQGEKGVREQIALGAERFEEGGRSPLQSRCVQLARMGCVVFFYDMIGYADSVQIPMSLAHGFAKQRPEMNTTENWGLFSPQAEAHLQSVMGLQIWNSIRALDFLMSLPEVDPARVAVTGASGGGTQTFILCALDPRPAVAFPAVMVSTAMQGGCTCENTSLLRIGTGNVEIAALFAPKPLGMTAANDWTKEMPTKGFPELKQHYAMMGAPDNVMLKPLLHFEHNYNSVSRMAMYGWLNRYLILGFAEPVIESDYHRLTTAELSVWDANHPKPQGGPEFERKLLSYLTTCADRQMEAASESPARFREVAGAGVTAIIGRTFAEVGETEFKITKKTERESGREMDGLLRNKAHHEELPIVLLHPKKPENRSVIWIDVRGKAGLFNGDKPTAAVQKLLDSGAVVLGADLFMQGEFLADGKPMVRTRQVNNPREFGGYTFGYNDCLFSQRTHDVMTIIKFAKEHAHGGKLAVVGFEGAGPWVAAALTQAREAIDCAAIDTGGFRFGKLLDMWDVNFMPGGAKYGDLPGMIALCAPSKLWISGEKEPGVARKIYGAAGAERNLVISESAERVDEAVRWLLEGGGL